MLVLDRAHFDHMTGADKALQREVLELFRQQVDGWRAAFAAQPGWRELVHTMKGSARGVGFVALASACEAAEGASDSDTLAKLAEVAAALDTALAALEQFAADAG
ncbi:MAG: Hpt domain-containing protein [Hyphomonadaceae bacterium]